MSLQPKKKDIESFINSGKSQKFAHYVSAAFLLMNLSKYLIDESEDMAKEYNMTLGEIRKFLSSANQNYERFACSLREIVNRSGTEKQMHFFSDFENLLEILEECIKINIDKENLIQKNKDLNGK